MRQAAKRDGNEAEIVSALEAGGCSVIRLSQEGVCDLIVGRHEVNYLIEVKELHGTLTDAQVKFFEDWRGQKAVARTIDEALEVVGL